MEGYHTLSTDIWGKICTDWFTECSDGYIVSIWCKFLHFPLPLNTAILTMCNSPNILCPTSREQNKSHLHFIFHWRLSKTTLDFLNGLINLHCTFKTPFKVSPKAKTIINSDFRDGIPTLLEVFLRHFKKMGMIK